ncbi:unnamed protein product [Phyllotreta striolata]|uniref:Uncharacterized protein n=1 Tax=Phyllotreta striolata TaxID=444603 RepID=A0A9N9TXE7_PHYSR|nr:unnamed protein product [Phyllotreta striolata]
MDSSTKSKSKHNGIEVSKVNKEGDNKSKRTRTKRDILQPPPRINVGPDGKEEEPF